MSEHEITVINNTLAEHQLIWHGVCVWLYSDLMEKYDG